MFPLLDLGDASYTHQKHDALLYTVTQIVHK